MVTVADEGSSEISESVVFSVTLKTSSFSSTESSIMGIMVVQDSFIPGENIITSSTDV